MVAALNLTLSTQGGKRDAVRRMKKREAIKREGRKWVGEGKRRAKGAKAKSEEDRRGRRAEPRVRKGEIIKKVRKQRRRGVPTAKMAVPLAERARSF